MTLPLRLELCREPVREAVAWYIASADPRRWLEEITRWNVPMSGIRLWVVPRSAAERRTRGVLVTAPPGSRPAVSPGALPFGREGESLHLPVDARLDPPLSREEIARHLAGDLQVLMPPDTLVGFAREDGLGVHHLLARPAPGTEGWDRARSGVAPPPPLAAVTLARPPTVEAALLPGQEDIGSEPLEDLPPTPREDRPGFVRQAGWQIGHGLARTLHAVTGGGEKETGPGEGAGKSAGETAGGGRGWLAGLSKWSGKMMESLEARLRAARHGEVDRLLDLLKTDPDRALRFAPPLSGPAHRGVAVPTATLGERPVEFHLRRLGGGGAADRWEIPWEIHTELVRYYHEAASREVALGRYRRAAYVYAELLGDYPAAANVLRQGKHHREAAVLYRDHLGKPLEAARCLEQGGLLSEAIEIYEAEKRHEKVGDLYRLLENPAAAERAYLLAVAEHLNTGDVLGAARLYEERLDSPEEALEVLASAWPHAATAASCLRARFDLMGRLGRHEEAHALVESVRREALPPRKISRLVHTLVHVTRSYPDRRTRQRAADASRVLIGGQLPDAGPEALGELIHDLCRSAPEDRLLKRDAHRYVGRRRRAVAGRPASRGRGPAAPRSDLLELRTLELPRWFDWHSFVSVGEILYAAGLRKVGPTPGVGISRRTWRAEHSDLAVYELRARELPSTLTADPCESGPTIVGIPGGPLLNERAWPEVVFPSGPLTVGMPSWMPRNPLGCAYDRNGILRVFRVKEDQLILSDYSGSGELLRSRALFPVSPGELEYIPSARILPRADGIWFPWGSTLVRIRPDGVADRLECRGPPLGLTGTIPHTRPRVALTFESGCQVLGGGDEWGQGKSFGSLLVGARALFTRDGLLVVVTRDEGRIYRIQDQHATQKLAFNTPGIRPLALVRTDAADEFALITEDGLVHVYRTPALS